MPFPSQTALPFDHRTVESLPANKRGCYGLYVEGRWVYVGRSLDIRGRLLDHLDGDNACITRWAPTHFVTVVTNDDVNQERELINELRPACNIQFG